MKRWQRKQRIKEMKAARKAQKRKQRDQALGESQAQQPSLAGDLNQSPACQGRDSGESSFNQEEAVTATPATPVAGLAAPTLLPAYTVEEAVTDVAQAGAQARDAIKRSGLVSADEAAEMLSVASRHLSDVIDAGHRALKQVSPQRLQEAMEAINGAQTGLSVPPATHGTPQQRPRRGSDPVITLMKLMIQATSLLQRVLFRLHPHLRRAA